ncbi:right-handed parallel beta-helix repeat-containing protein [Anaerobaca lacustris]|uniref:Right-handed parallel beta-helix repeat-containing protein n=1 Tax=Anaerobaca lacustris TaxID=3044600 RepID=A0AAW6TX30_9BACT|nr:right-handed parallel beta-helix repeat-containing protein [Sedimentisphaerales bacterium M17dextr]
MFAVSKQIAGGIGPLMWSVLLLLGARTEGATANPLPSVHALVEAAERGAVIELPAGTFELDRPLVIDKPLSLAGRGKDRTVLRSTAGQTGAMLIVRNVSGVHLARFTLDGAGNAHVSQGIVLSNGSGHRLEELCIRDIPGSGDFGPHGIYASANVTDSVFARLEIRNIGCDSEWGAGIRIGKGGRGNTIEDNDLSGFGRGGILTTHGSTDTRILRNSVREFGFAGPGLGIEVWGSGRRVVIEDNSVDHWISVDGQEDVAIRRNAITGAADPARIGSYVLELVNSQRVVMTDNVASGGNQIGISVSNRARKDLAYWARNRMAGCQTWGAQIQGEEGGAHRMYFYRNVFEQTRKSERSLYPGAAGHGFRFNGNAFEMVLHANRMVGNRGAGIQLGGPNLDRLTFIENVVQDNDGPAVAGAFRGDHLLWRADDVSGNQGGDNALTSKGFDERSLPDLAIRISADPKTGKPVTFQLEGFDPARFSEVLWDLDHGIPRTGRTVEHTYDCPGRHRIAAIAWTTDGQATLAEATLTLTD